MTIPTTQYFGEAYYLNNSGTNSLDGFKITAGPNSPIYTWHGDFGAPVYDPTLNSIYIGGTNVGTYNGLTSLFGTITWTADGEDVGTFDLDSFVVDALDGPYAVQITAVSYGNQVTTAWSVAEFGRHTIDVDASLFNDILSFTVTIYRADGAGSDTAGLDMLSMSLTDVKAAGPTTGNPSTAGVGGTYTFEPDSGTLTGFNWTTKKGSYVLDSADSVKLIIEAVNDVLIDPADLVENPMGWGLYHGLNVLETSLKFHATDNSDGVQPHVFDLKSLYLSNVGAGATQTYRITTDTGVFETITLGDDESRVITFTQPGFLGIRNFTITAETDLNTGNDVSGEYIVLVDNIVLENIKDVTGPSVMSVSVPANGTYAPGDDLTFTVNFDEAVILATEGGTPRLEIHIGGQAVFAEFVSGSETKALTFRHTVQKDQSDYDGITISGLQLNGSTLKDVAGNNANPDLNLVPSTVGIKVDGVAPTLFITSDKPSLHAGQTATITFTFTEDPGSTFTWNGTSGDVLISGGTLSAISGSGLTRTAVFTPAAGINNGTASITVAASAYTDTAGNNGGAGITPSITFDTLAPTLTISSSKSALKAGETATITFTFSEDPGTSLSWDGSSGDVTVSGGTLSAISGTGTTRTATFTPSANTNGGTASITIAGSAYTDAAGNSGTAGTTPSFTFDTLAPSAPSVPALTLGSDTGTSNSDGITANNKPTFTGTAEAGATVILYDSNGNVIGTGTAVGGTWSITPTIALAHGAQTITARAIDAAGNVSPASAGQTITIDAIAPTLAITSNVTQLKARETATITFTFSEDPGFTFTAADVHVEGGTLSALSGSGLTRTAVFTPDANVNDGTASITVAAGSYVDAAGNNGGAGATPVLTFDTRAPAAPSTPDLDQGSDTGVSNSDNITGDTRPTFSGTAEVGATVTLYDGSTAIGSTIATDGTWRITSDRPLAKGMHSIIAKATDLAGNEGAGSSALTIWVETAAPTTEITTISLSADTGASATDLVTRTATQTISGQLSAVLGAGERVEVSFDNGAHWTTANATTGTDTWSLAATLTAGTHTLQMRVVNAIGSSGPVHQQDYTLDTAAPTVAISSSASQLKAGESATITFTFSEDPGATFGWDGSVGDITVSGGTLSALEGSGLIRTAIFTPDAGVNSGSASITVLAGSYSDLAGNTGTAGATPSLSFDTLLPTRPVPTLALDTGVAGDLITGSGQVLVSGLEAGAVWQYSTDAGGSWITGSGSSFTLQGTGTKTAMVRQFDQAGNVSLNSAPLTFTLASSPAAGLDAVSMSWLAQKAGNLLANDTDPDGNTLVVTGIAYGSLAGSVGASLKGAFGILTLESDGSYTYAATGGSLAPGQTGTDQFTYTVSDPWRQTATAIVTFSVTSSAVTEVVGTKVFNPDHAAGQVYRLYDALLDRAPDLSGLESWTAALENGTSLQAVAQGILQSSEFMSQAGSLDNDAFVDLIYKNALGRDATADQSATWWVSLLDQGASRAQVAANISESQEHKDSTKAVFDEGVYVPNHVASEVARLYHAAFGRLSDSDGLVYWTSALESGASLDAVADGFVFSSEFQAGHGGLANRQFVEQLYLNALSRAGDTGGVDFWTRLLDSGQADQGDVLLGFSESLEHKTKIAHLFDSGILIA